jgi:negative regulator of sigma E activity
MAGQRGSQRSYRHRAPRSERGLFHSGPRFVLIVGLLAAASTGPTAAVVAAGSAVLSDANGPAAAPLLATGPVVTTVQVPAPAQPADDQPADPGTPARVRPQLQRVSMAAPTCVPTHKPPMRAE